MNVGPFDVRPVPLSAAGQADPPPDPATRPDLIALPEGSGYAYARLSVNYYTGAGQ